MAILKKRTSSKQIPDAKALNRAPLSSVINSVGNNPNLGGGAGSITSVGGSKPSLTTGTSSTPSITNNSSSGTKPSLTTKTTGAPKQTLTSATKPSSSTSSKVVNALTGAAIGAGTKLLIDKVTGKPVASQPSSGSGAPKISTNTGTPANSNTAKVAAANAAAKKAQEVRAAEIKAKQAAADAAKNPTSVIKNPATGKPTGTGFGDDKEEFTTDSLGNTYKTMPDGTSVLYRAAEVAEDEFMTDSLGNVYKTMPDGSYELYRAAEVENDIEVTPPNTGGSDNSEVPAFEPEYFEDSLGNIYVSNANGEYDLYRAAEVEDDGDAFTQTPSEPEYFEDSLGNVYVQGSSGEYELYRAAEVPEDIVEEDYNLFNPDYIDYDVNDRYSTEEDDGDEYYDYKRGGLITMMKQGGVAHMASGGYMPEGAVDNGDGTYTIGRFTYDMMTDDYLYSSDDGQITNVNPDVVYSSTPEEDYYTTDSLGNIFKNDVFYRAAEVPEDITSAGSGSRSPSLGSYLDKGVDVFKGLVGGGYDALTGALGTTAGAAGAGALIATLLGEDFSGGTGNQNAGLDMSKVGVINPRTTDFGIGPTRFVGYDDYGTGGGDYTPNEELLRNLNAPGFNPVREGDYGYEEVPAETATEAPKMASGGLSSMATPVASYYTFGQPADILANLGMRAQPPMNPPEMMPQIGQQQSPQQTQQQGLPQQAPPQMAQQMPQGMPQQGMMPQQQGMPPPMRKGGLPHVSDVPLTQGRMDFRKGAAVHGAGDGQSDDIPAMLADGEYVIDAETVAQIGNGSTKAGAQALDKFRESIRAHKRSAPINKIPPKTKALTSYLKGAK